MSNPINLLTTCEELNVCVLHRADASFGGLMVAYGDFECAKCKLRFYAEIIEEIFRLWQSAQRPVESLDAPPTD
jgi:hypothetical protein